MPESVSPSHGQRENNPLFDAFEAEAEDPRDQQIRDLQTALAAEKDARKEERFFFIFLTMLFFDIALFENMENWAVPIVITILQLVFLALIAKRLGMEEVSTLFNRLVGRIADGVSGNGG